MTMKIAMTMMKMTRRKRIEHLKESQQPLEKMGMKRSKRVQVRALQ